MLFSQTRAVFDICYTCSIPHPIVSYVISVSILLAPDREKAAQKTLIINVVKIDVSFVTSSAKQNAPADKIELKKYANPSIARSFITSRKAGQHVLLVQGQGGGWGWGR